MSPSDTRSRRRSTRAEPIPISSAGTASSSRLRTLGVVGSVMGLLPVGLILPDEPQRGISHAFARMSSCSAAALRMKRMIQVNTSVPATSSTAVSV